jgi:hypothetical protein
VQQWEKKNCNNEEFGSSLSRPWDAQQWKIKKPRQQNEKKTQKGGKELTL